MKSTWFFGKGKSVLEDQFLQPRFKPAFSVTQEFSVAEKVRKGEGERERKRGRKIRETKKKRNSLFSLSLSLSNPLSLSFSASQEYRWASSEMSVTAASSWICDAAERSLMISRERMTTSRESAVDRMALRPSRVFIILCKRKRERERGGERRGKEWVRRRDAMRVEIFKNKDWSDRLRETKELKDTLKHSPYLVMSDLSFSEGDLRRTSSENDLQNNWMPPKEERNIVSECNDSIFFLFPSPFSIKVWIQSIGSFKRECLRPSASLRERGPTFNNSIIADG